MKRHRWTQDNKLRLTVCALCGVVLRRDGKNMSAACRGVVEVKPRLAPTKEVPE